MTFRPLKYQLITEAEAAALLSVSKYKLQQDRVKGQGLRFIRIGRSVRYRLDDIEEYLDAHTFRSTSQQQDIKRGEHDHLASSGEGAV